MLICVEYGLIDSRFVCPRFSLSMPNPASDNGDLARQLTGHKVALEDMLRETDFNRLIPLPDCTLTSQEHVAAVALYQSHIVPGGSRELIASYFDRLPVWKFLEFLVKECPILLHGTHNGAIRSFEPRASQDNVIGGEQARVYASCSGVQACFYAVIDRSALAKIDGSGAICNSYHRSTGNGALREAFQFAVDHRALGHAIWRSGYIYVLPRESFSADHGFSQWYSTVSVAPLAIIHVRSSDFVLRDRVRGVDLLAYVTQFQSSPRNYPWWQDSTIYPLAATSGH